MKNIRLYAAMLLGSFILYSCKNSPEPAPSLEVQYSSTAIKSFEGTNIPIAYIGDTAHFTLSIGSNNEIKSVNFLKEVNGKYTEVDQLPAYVPTGDKKLFNIDFKYIIADTFNHKFNIKITDVNNQVIDSKYYIEFKPQGLQEWKAVKLYNKGLVAIYYGSDVSKFYTITDVTNTFDSSDPSTYYTKSVILLNYNESDPDPFFRGWKENTNGYFSGFNNYFKTNLSYSDVSVNQIIGNYKLNSANYTNRISQVTTGDVFIGKNEPASENHPYYILKVTDIADDGKTIAQGGTDLDYIQFDIKVVNGNRFK